MLRTTLIASAFLLVGTGYAFAQAMPANVMAMNGILMGEKGMTLYTFANDKEPNKSACNGNCANVWPPLRAVDNARNMGDWKVITRDDGTKQWSYKGRPIYYFAMDKAQGDKAGEGRGNGAWHVATP